MSSPEHKERYGITEPFGGAAFDKIERLLHDALGSPQQMNQGEGEHVWEHRVPSAIFAALIDTIRALDLARATAERERDVAAQMARQSRLAHAVERFNGKRSRHHSHTLDEITRLIERDVSARELWYRCLEETQAAYSAPIPPQPSEALLAHLEGARYQLETLIDEHWRQDVDKALGHVRGAFEALGNPAPRVVTPTPPTPLTDEAKRLVDDGAYLVVDATERSEPCVMEVERSGPNLGQYVLLEGGSGGLLGSSPDFDVMWKRFTAKGKQVAVGRREGDRTITATPPSATSATGVESAEADRLALAANASEEAWYWAQHNQFGRAFQSLGKVNDILIAEIRALKAKGGAL